MHGEAGFLGFKSLRVDTSPLRHQVGLGDGDWRPWTQVEAPCRGGCKSGVGVVKKVTQNKAVHVLRAAAN